MKELDGKYSYSRDDNGVLHLYRNGEKCDSLLSNPLISAIYKIEEFGEENKQAKEIIKMLHSDCYSIAECEDTNLGQWEDDLAKAEAFLKE